MGAGASCHPCLRINEDTIQVMNEDWDCIEQSPLLKGTCMKRTQIMRFLDITFADTLIIGAGRLGAAVWAPPFGRRRLGAGPYERGNRIL